MPSVARAPALACLQEADVKRIRIGMIGCGMVAQVMHLPFLDELPEFELVALSDISPAVLDGVAQRYPRATPCVDYRELVARDDVDAVAVCTPDHAAVAEEAARAGKHVFVEKPLCFTPEEGRSLAAAVETSGVRVMVLVRVAVSSVPAKGWLPSGLPSGGASSGA